MATFTHPPGASKVYGRRLTGTGWGDDIFNGAQTSWSIAPTTNVTLSEEEFDGKLATVRVTGGRLGVTYRLTLNYLTVGGHKSSRYITIKCDRVQ
jgi:hypothetical protein